VLLIQFIVLQVLVFAGVIFFLKKILYSDTQSAVNRLDKVYQDLLKKQKELSEKIQQAEKEYQRKKEEATQVVSKMKMEAMDELRTKEDEVLKKAKAQADELVNKARSSTEKFQREIEKELSAKMIDFASDIVCQSVDAKMAAALHQAMVTEFIDRGKDLDLSHVDAQLDKFTVKTPFALSENDQEAIKILISGKLNRTVQLEEVIDAKLIAGVLLQFGTLILDGSFTNAINEAGLDEKKKLEMQA